MSDTDDSTAEENKKPMSKSEIIEKLRGENCLFKDQEGVGHLAVGGKGAMVFPTSSRECAKFIRNWLVKHEGRYDINRNTVEEIQAIIDCIAEIDGETIPLNVRVAREDDSRGLPSKVWYDLKDGQYATEVDSEGWRIVPAPIKFRCYKHLHPQARPMKHNSRSLEVLRSLMPNLSNDDWLVFQVFLVSAFIPNYPRPTVLVDGPNGSGKTSFLKLVSSLIDPSGLSSGISMIRSPEELKRVASQSYVLFFDNVSRIGGETSDALATLSTGGATVCRTLYTTGDSSIYSDIYRTVLINGIPKVATRADLLDRSLSFSLKRLKPSERRSQAELDNYLNEHKSEILGSVCNILSDTLGKLGKVKIKGKPPRLVDFSEIGYCVAESIEDYNGSMFLEAYKKMREKSDQFAIDASPVAQAVQYMLSFTDEWSGTPYELWSLTIKDGHEITQEEMQLRQELRSNPYFPKSPATLSKELIRSEAVLASVGIDIEATKDGKSIWKNGRRTITLRKHSDKQDHKSS